MRFILSGILSLLVLASVDVATAEEPVSSRPTFDCERALTPLARIICAGPEGVKADWDLTLAFWPYFASVADSSQESFWKEHVAWLKSLEPSCELNQDDVFFSPRQVQCVADAYRARANAYRARLTGEALAESKASPDLLARIQQKLIERGHLSGRVDGQFGPQTREAIRKYQRENGFPPSGFLSSYEQKWLMRGG